MKIVSTLVAVCLGCSFAIREVDVPHIEINLFDPARAYDTTTAFAGTATANASNTRIIVGGPPNDWS